MPKFEFKTVRLDKDSSDGTEKYICGGKEYDNYKKLFNDLGSAGYELISTAPIFSGFEGKLSTTSVIYWFQKLIQ